VRWGCVDVSCNALYTFKMAACLNSSWVKHCLYMFGSGRSAAYRDGGPASASALARQAAAGAVSISASTSPPRSERAACGLSTCHAASCFQFNSTAFVLDRDTDPRQKASDAWL